MPPAAYCGHCIRHWHVCTAFRGERRLDDFRLFAGSQEEENEVLTRATAGA
ncbi:hypothetical protein J3D48_006319 [Pseudomonas fluorescens]|nr:hypothetical protein [Pseudomonas fluorescens]